LYLHWETKIKKNKKSNTDNTKQRMFSTRYDKMCIYMVRTCWKIWYVRKYISYHKESWVKQPAGLNLQSIFHRRHIFISNYFSYYNNRNSYNHIVMFNIHIVIYNMALQSASTYVRTCRNTRQHRMITLYSTVKCCTYVRTCRNSLYSTVVWYNRTKIQI